MERIIQSIPLLVVDSKQEFSDVKELLRISREYLLAYYIRTESTTSTLESDAKRNVELNAYFTHCQLESIHRLLTLKNAMTAAYKSKNFIAAAGFCKRILENPDISSERNAKLADMVNLFPLSYFRI